MGTKKLASRITVRRTSLYDADSGISFNAIRQAVNSRAKDGYSSQFSLDYVLVEKDRMCASNGHFLTVAELPSGIYNPGLYVVVKNTKTMVDLIIDNDREVSFPDVDNLMKLRPATTSELDLLEIGGDTRGISFNWTKIIKAMPEGSTIDFDLFRKAEYAEKAFIPKDKDEMLVLTGSKHIIFMMPMRMDW